MRVDVGATPGPAPQDAEDPRSAALLQFLAPAGGIQTVPWAVLRDRQETRSLLDRRFVLVGVDEPSDPRRDTPFSKDPIPGVLLHAYAVNPPSDESDLRPIDRALLPEQLGERGQKGYFVQGRDDFEDLVLGKPVFHWFALAAVAFLVFELLFQLFIRRAVKSS